MIKNGTLVEVGVAASFKDHKLGWVVRKCIKDGGTIVYIPGDELPYHEYCVKETDFIMPVKKRGDNFSGEIPL
jgi:hypothetical protein